MQITRGGDWRAYRKYNGTVYEHEGIDLRAVDGNGNPINIIASSPGIVDQIRWYDPGTGYGKYIRLRHEYMGEVYRTWYAHLSRIRSDIRIGDVVNRKELLGVAGSTGNSTGIHLHFSLEWIGHGESGNFIWGDWINPKPHLGLS
jgi:murein DD-endopeptidase MepM/ murein hydrolase activator NlpD